MSDDSQTWRDEFSDPMTEPWMLRWTLDGSAALSNGEQGLDLEANTQQVVLWFDPVVRGNFRIRFDYTRTDAVGDTASAVLFLQAEGIGGKFPKDIFLWKGRRNFDTYLLQQNDITWYTDFMSGLQVNYSRKGGFVRFRQNPGYHLLGDDLPDQGIFKVGQTCRVTAVKNGLSLQFRARNLQNGGMIEKTVGLRADLPPIVSGRCGLSLMTPRAARFENFEMTASSEPV